MATLILTTVGGVIGGPIGAALGGALGNAIDRTVLLKPKGRQGPRLTELAVQTSSYGTSIPMVFGAMRVAGTVVWATDLRETRTKSGGGKGKPSTTAYTYSASFAVLLSARAIGGVGRIWADGKLLRGAAGDWKAQTGFRLHPGSETQQPDPLIAAVEGLARAPAMRGQAYAVFEDLQLADYGNRIPSLTFEVFADPAPVTVGAIAATFGVAAEGPGRPLTGFSAYGDSVRGVLETLASVDGAWFAADAGGITLYSGPGPTRSVRDAGAAADGATGRRTRSRTPVEAAPRTLSLAHYDPARDYQTGLQHVRRAGDGAREERVELPVVLDAVDARAVAAAMLARAHAGRERRTVTMPFDGASPPPGSRVRIDGETAVWRVVRWTLERMVVRLELERIVRAPVARRAVSGRVNPAPDVVHGSTRLHVFELPTLDDQVATIPRLSVAAGGGAGWRQAALLLSLDDGASWTGAGAASLPATLGTVVRPPRVAPATLVDTTGSVEIVLDDPTATLSDADDIVLDGGGNLALVGRELLQFGRAEQLGAGRWRLSRLLRGRRGTEWAIAGHEVGDAFVLIEPEAIVSLDLPLTALGGTARVLASGIGDVAGPAAASLVVTGAALPPPSPVALTYTRLSDGSVTLAWTRRSRAGWRWPDGGDVPLVEESERYRVTIGATTQVVAEPRATLTAADSIGGGEVTVCQLGTFAPSLPARIMLPPA